MAKYAVNDRAVEKARRLIEARSYVLDSRWGDVQPGAAADVELLREAAIAVLLDDGDVGLIHGLVGDALRDALDPNAAIHP